MSVSELNNSFYEKTECFSGYSSSPEDKQRFLQAQQTALGPSTQIQMIQLNDSSSSRMQKIFDQCFNWDETQQFYRLSTASHLDRQIMSAECDTRGKENNPRTAYALFHDKKIIAIIKPASEVRGAPNYPRAERGQDNNLPAKPGVSPELEIVNEAIAAGFFPFSLDGCIAKIQSDAFRNKEHSPEFCYCMPFIPDCRPLSRYSAREKAGLFSSNLPILYQSMLSDILFCNTDGNPENYLVTNEKKLLPIDRCNILPALFASGGIFSWLESPEAKQPFPDDIKQQIAAFDPEKIKQKILAAFPGYPKESLMTLDVCCFLLQKGTASPLNLTPVQIATFIVDLGIIDSFWENTSILKLQFEKAMLKNLSLADTIESTIKPFICKALCTLSEAPIAHDQPIADLLQNIAAVIQSSENTDASPLLPSEGPGETPCRDTPFSPTLCSPTREM